MNHTSWAGFCAASPETRGGRRQGHEKETWWQSAQSNVSDWRRLHGVMVDKRLKHAEGGVWLQAGSITLHDSAHLPAAHTSDSSSVSRLESNRHEVVTCVASFTNVCMKKFKLLGDVTQNDHQIYWTRLFCCHHCAYVVSRVQNIGDGYRRKTKITTLVRPGQVKRWF